MKLYIIPSSLIKEKFREPLKKSKYSPAHKIISAHLKNALFVESAGRVQTFLKDPFIFEIASSAIIDYSAHAPADIQHIDIKKPALPSAKELGVNALDICHNTIYNIHRDLSLKERGTLYVENKLCFNRTGFASKALEKVLSLMAIPSRYFIDSKIEAITTIIKTSNDFHVPYHQPPKDWGEWQPDGAD